MCNPSHTPNQSSFAIQTETKFFTYQPAGDHSVVLQSGESLPGFSLAYETYGELNDSRDNAILLFHALTGSQHAGGFCQDVPGLAVTWTKELQHGWWDSFIGPGRALDTSKFFVICANVLGGCYGSTGPSSIDPLTGNPFGGNFPRVSVADMVDAQIKLIDHLGIDQLHACIGGSMGGMMCLSLATRYSERVKIVIPIASGLETSPLQRLHNFEQVFAIESDPSFQNGFYYDGPRPDQGLALARMISHKTFISLATMEDRASKEIRPTREGFSWYKMNRPLESYMFHKGTKFVKRFDANSYLRIIDAWQRFDAFHDAEVETASELFAVCRNQQFLIFSIDSDVCFYPEQQSELERALGEAGVAAIHVTVHSSKGHDSFLLEPELFTPHIAYALNRDKSPGRA